MQEDRKHGLHCEYFKVLIICYGAVGVEAKHSTWETPVAERYTQYFVADAPVAQVADAACNVA